MVGPPPEQLESGGHGSDGVNMKELSEFLLLHHDYSLPPKTRHSTKSNISSKQTKKRNSTIQQNETKNIPEISISVPDMESEIVDFSESISFNDLDSLVNLNLSSNDSLSVSAGSNSPISSRLSDNGYESLDSPNSLTDLDIWDPCVTELFPTLV